MPRHRVHREVAPRHIVLNTAGTHHRLRVTAVRIEPIQTVRGNLDAFAIHHRRDATELDTRLHHRNACSP